MVCTTCSRSLRLESSNLSRELSDPDRSHRLLSVASKMKLTLRYVIGLIVAAFTVTISIIPGGEVLTYPFKLFVTVVHEFCHGFAAVVTGGSVHGMSINSDMSGEATTSGGNVFIIASAGYVGTSLLGALCIALLKKGISSQFIIVIFAMITLSALFWTSNLSFGTGITLVMCLTLIFCSTQLILAELMTIIMSLQLLVGSFSDLKTLVFLSNSSNVYTDAVLMQSVTGIPSIAWALAWSVLSVYLTYKVIKR